MSQDGPRVSSRVRALPIDGPEERLARAEERVRAFERADGAVLRSLVEISQEQDYQGAVLAWMVHSTQAIAARLGVELAPVPVDPNAETQPLETQRSERPEPQEHANGSTESPQEEVR